MIPPRYNMKEFSNAVETIYNLLHAADKPPQIIPYPKIKSHWRVVRFSFS